MSLETQATASGDLGDLVSSSGAATIYPTDDALLAVLQARFRGDLPYTRLSSTHLLAVNPHKTLGHLSDASAEEYAERCYHDTALPLADSPRPLQPHIYELAARVYLLMRRRNTSQSLVARGITGAGKTATVRLFVDQVLRLSTHSKKERRLADQVKALHTVLDAFGNSKTLMNPNASRHARFLELHFTDNGGLAGAKVLAYGLDKSKLARLAHEERTFHVFYQLLAGSTPQERDNFALEDPTDYALLASSGCYRLPSGPFSDDSIAMSELRTAMRTLGFKPKHTSAINSLLSAILLLGNLQFIDADHRDVSAHIANAHVLETVSRLLGVAADDLAQVLTNKTNYVKKELFTVLLGKEQSERQRDQCVRDLYAILFSFIVETCNHRLSTPESHTQIIILDQPGFQTRGPSGTSSISLSGVQPLVAAYGPNSFDDFCINFADELLHSYVLRQTFEDEGWNGILASDGVSLPAVSTMDNGACVELLRGSEPGQRKPVGGVISVMHKACSSFKKGAEHNMLAELTNNFGVHASYVSAQTGFGINHYAGSATYDATLFVERDADLVDPAFVTLLRNSSDVFIAKLLSGPSLAAERHTKDENTLVQAQVSSLPLRKPTMMEDSPRLDPSKTYPITTQLNHISSEIFAALDKTKVWTLSCIRPNDSGTPNSFDKRRVKAQIKSLLLSDWVARRHVEYVAGYRKAEFCERYVATMRGSDEERVQQCARANGWTEGIDYVLGHDYVWVGYDAWKTVEDSLRIAERGVFGDVSREGGEDDGEDDAETEFTHSVHQHQHPTQSPGYESSQGLVSAYGMGGLRTPTTPGDVWDKEESSSSVGGSPDPNGPRSTTGMTVKDAPNAVEELPTSRTRRVWLWIVWGVTWWMPSYLLHHLGRMKRPDVRLAWREKVTIFWLIFLFNAVVIFYIVEFGRLLCPKYDKAWGANEVEQHTGRNDFWVTIQGNVYDVSNFVYGDHSRGFSLPSNSPDLLEQMAGQDLTVYFPIPLTLGCAGLVADDTIALSGANATSQVAVQQAVHRSGTLAQYPTSSLADGNWYINSFLTTMKDYKKGPLVWEKKKVEASALDQDLKKIWAFYHGKLYDLTDYVYTLGLNQNNPLYNFLDTKVVDVFRMRAGQEVGEELDKVLANMDAVTRVRHTRCLSNVFYAGDVDFRKSARCQVQNYLLIIASAVLMASMALKFLAALQLGPKRSPELQDKFVLCQVPCYTEGEDSLRRTIDSLAALNYDDKRKLIFIICDGNIIGSGNDRTTPRIVLDILGIDPKVDPEPLLFKSVGEGSKALNYGKIYSGLYEFEGHVVPYMVVVKVGKPTERSKPGNRGKRDSQILLLHYLNRVHFDLPMSPLELEIYHQMRNVIGIDPAFYEYIFTIDADTTVTPEALNRLVASSADDSKIIGICGETKLTNEEGSWWTMIQVYEYYISHHLSKAFESLFGSVTCLPGCFTLYRIRTADKGRPIIISNRIIEEYSEPNVDTLHKKNLFSLGEDRFLTTLLMKHFPTFKTKFCPDAVAHTMAPESWRVLFSQRRRWINSTVHNLCELVILDELFGFCCFSMRFFVFIDLLGTIILPATVVYLVYLIVVVATKASAFPVIAIIMLGVTYGLQAIIFIIKREFMLIGWMVVYLLSYPIYSFFLPVYSFWCMDEFSWGNTRVVVGEGKEKKVLMNEDEKFDDSMIPLKKFSEYEAEAWDTGSRHSDDTGYDSKTHRTARSGMPRSRSNSPHPQSQLGHGQDYYRDTNPTNPSASRGGFGGSQHSHSNTSFHQQHPMSTYGQAPMFSPFGGGHGSVAGGSEYGGVGMMGPMGMGPMGMGGMGMPLQMQASGPQSVYGMGMMPGFGMPGMGSGSMGLGGGLGGSPSGSQIGHGQSPGVPVSTPGGARPLSTFSMATSVNPFAGPSLNPSPSDEELFGALRMYLSTQDLMSVTKKTAREAIAARFPKADLGPRKDFLNQSIDRILSES